MPNLLCMVATPTRELFSGEIAYADVPGSEGNYGVLSGHEMLVAKNSPGVLTLWMDAAGNEKRRFAFENIAPWMHGNRRSEAHGATAAPRAAAVFSAVMVR